jgi:pimeloyl-ACP methyl ester carboxylesterase
VRRLRGADRETTIVLVHGAHAESASWNGVISRLQAAGHRVIAAANPLRSLSGDAAFVAALLASIDGPIVLAGHSYGGMVATNAAVGNDNVKALVYVASLAPEKGENVPDLTGKYPGAPLGDAVVEVPQPGRHRRLLRRAERVLPALRGRPGPRAGRT